MVQLVPWFRCLSLFPWFGWFRGFDGSVGSVDCLVQLVPTSQLIGSVGFYDSVGSAGPIGFLGSVRPSQCPLRLSGAAWTQDSEAKYWYWSQVI